MQSIDILYVLYLIYFIYIYILYISNMSINIIYISQQNHWILFRRLKRLSYHEFDSHWELTLCSYFGYCFTSCHIYHSWNLVQVIIKLKRNITYDHRKYQENPALNALCYKKLGSSLTPQSCSCFEYFWAESC